VRREEKGRMFFFEKKNQKTFDCWFECEGAGCLPLLAK
jgi:hypothetical protein